jgi:hypothetical protein
VKSRQSSELEKLLSMDPGKDIILHELDVPDYGRLAETSYNMSQFFTKLPSSFWLNKLAYYLAQAPDDVKVQFIIKNNLKLLQIVFKEVVLKSRTVINVTPLQLVYGAGDGEMCGTLTPFFEEMYGSFDGRNEMQKQISEMKNDHKPFDFNPIIQAISNEFFNLGKDAATGKWILNPATLAAIKIFREDFDASQPKIIDKGMHFRWETLQELNNAYAEAAVQWGYDYKKCALLEDAAFAWVLNYVPENGAQACSQGFYYLQKNNPEPFKRMQKTRDEKNFYEALKQQSAEFLLDGSCVDIIFGGARRRVFGCAGSAKLQNFCRAKTSNLQNLCGSTHTLNGPGV